MIKYAVFFCLLLQFIFVNFSFSQSNYQMRITNGQLVDNSTYQFDVVLSAQNNFEMTSYQCVISFYCNSMSKDSYNFSFVNGTSQLLNKPTLGLSANLKNNKIELTFASRALTDIYGNNSLRVGTFRVHREKNTFDLKSIFVNWNFSGDNITILIGKLFSDITNQADFSSDMMLTGVNDDKAQIPNDFQLEQNYPNPFNPSTKIKFYLKESGKVKLDVFNILGEKVVELVNGKLPAGSHEVVFNANDLASGIYIYKLNIEDKFNSVKKMILEK